MTFGEAGHVEFGELKNKVPKIQGQCVGWAISPLLALILSSVCIFVGEKFGRGRRVLQVHLLVFLGHPFVFIPGAFLNPRWT